MCHAHEIEVSAGAQTIAAGAIAFIVNIKTGPDAKLPLVGVSCAIAQGATG
jgi:hypothetical protein